MPNEVVNALVTGQATSFSEQREQAVYEVAHALSGRRWIPRSLYARAVATLAHDRITDMLVLMGFYTAVSLTLMFYDVPAGEPGLKR